jgi:hypothetical protein
MARLPPFCTLRLPLADLWAIMTARRSSSTWNVTCNTNTASDVPVTESEDLDNWVFFGQMCWRACIP